MDVRRRPTATAEAADHPPEPRASDALPLPLYLTNGFFLGVFFASTYYLYRRWIYKAQSSIPLHSLTFYELAGVIGLMASIIYLLGFFGIDFVQAFINKNENYDEDQRFILDENRSIHCSLPPKPISRPKIDMDLPLEDEEIVNRVVSGEIPSYSLESKLGDCFRAAKIRREAIQRQTGRSLEGLPLEGFDYDSILGQCCELPVGYVQIPVGVVGPLLLNGCEYSVPMATTEGCLVASTNRGCKTIYASGGADCVLFRDGMTRATVVRFSTAKRATELKFFLEDPLNFDTLSVVFNK